MIIMIIQQPRRKVPVKQTSSSLSHHQVYPKRTLMHRYLSEHVGSENGLPYHRWSLTAGFQFVRNSAGCAEPLRDRLSHSIAAAFSSDNALRKDNICPVSMSQSQPYTVLCRLSASSRPHPVCCQPARRCAISNSPSSDPLSTATCLRNGPPQSHFLPRRLTTFVL